METTTDEGDQKFTIIEPEQDAGRIDLDDIPSIPPSRENSVLVDKIDVIEEPESEEKFGFAVDDFQPGKSVVIVRGDNAGCFASLQMNGPSVKRKDEFYGVNITGNDGSVTGFWIHPDDLQRKRFLPNEEVLIIKGLYSGRTAIIQSVQEKLKFKNGKYSVDVLVSNDQFQASWVHFNDMIPTEEQLMTFKASDLGFSLDGDRVSGIKPGGNAEKMGVLRGWTIKDINGVQNPSQEQIIEVIKESKRSDTTFAIIFDPTTTRIESSKGYHQTEETNEKNTKDENCVCF